MRASARSGKAPRCRVAVRHGDAPRSPRQDPGGGPVTPYVLPRGWGADLAVKVRRPLPNNGGGRGAFPGQARPSQTRKYGQCLAGRERAPQTHGIVAKNGRRRLPCDGRAAQGGWGATRTAVRILCFASHLRGWSPRQAAGFGCLTAGAFRRLAAGRCTWQAAGMDRRDGRRRQGSGRRRDSRRESGPARGGRHVVRSRVRKPAPAAPLRRPPWRGDRGVRRRNAAPAAGAPRAPQGTGGAAHARRRRHGGRGCRAPRSDRPAALPSPGPIARPAQATFLIARRRRGPCLRPPHTLP